MDDLTKLSAAQQRYKRAAHATKTGHLIALRKAMNETLEAELARRPKWTYTTTTNLIGYTK